MIHAQGVSNEEHEMETKVNKTFREILQSIICDRYESGDAAYRAIDEARAADLITAVEARDLESRVEAPYA